MKKIQEYKNGKILNRNELTPGKFLTEIMQIIQSVEIPKPMVNHDEFRRKYSQRVLKTLQKNIVHSCNDKTYKFNKNYSQQFPRNQMLLWGVLFTALKEILIDESFDSKTKKLNKISAEEYNKMPKRYRSAFKKASFIPNTYICETAPESEKYNLILDCESSDKFDETHKEITKLLSIVYERIENGYLEWNPKVGSVEYVSDTTVAPETGLFKKHLVSDEQMAAITALCAIFRNIAKSCVITETKHGAKAVLDEYANAKKRENIVLNAYQYVEDMRECAKKLASLKNDNLTKRHQNIKRDVLMALRENIHTFTK